MLREQPSGRQFSQDIASHRQGFERAHAESKMTIRVEIDHAARSRVQIDALLRREASQFEGWHDRGKQSLQDRQQQFGEEVQITGETEGAAMLVAELDDAGKRGEALRVQAANEAKVDVATR